MLACIYEYIYVHACMPQYTSTSMVHSHMWIYARTYIHHVCIQSRICAHAQICMRACTTHVYIGGSGFMFQLIIRTYIVADLRSCTQTCICMGKCMHARICMVYSVRTYIHAIMLPRTHMHTGMYARTCKLALWQARTYLHVRVQV